MDRLEVAKTGVRDLTPLKGMQLTVLAAHHTRITDLTPLKGMRLTQLYVADTGVTDLSPLAGMRLTFLMITPGKITKGLDLVRSMGSLLHLGYDQGTFLWPPAEFWEKYDAGELK